MKLAVLFTCTLLMVLGRSTACGQSIDTVNMTFVSEHEYSWTYSAYTALFDIQDRPYIYTASSELGVVTFDISNINDPTPVDTILPAEFGSLKPQNLFLEGDLVYVALGGFLGIFPQNPGLAILDVTDPADPLIVSQWDTTAFQQGAAVVEVKDGVAYLGAMEDGVMILDVSDPANIQFMSNAMMDENFPHVPGLFSHPNARGLSIKGDTLIVANDAGGLRMVDVSDPYNPVEVGKYVNWALDSVAQPAYNNVLLVEDYAYIPVDYCGLDVVYVSDTNMVGVLWDDPWGCGPTNWDGNPGHTNQVSRHGDLIFVSGADTEAIVYDISNRENPVQVGVFANVGDSIVSWGIDVNDQYICLALVDNALAQTPYISDQGGIIILEWQSIVGVQEKEPDQFSVFPNPAQDRIQLTFADPRSRDIRLVDQLGRLLHIGTSTSEKAIIDVSFLEKGVYHIVINGDGSRTEKLVKN